MAAEKTDIDGYEFEVERRSNTKRISLVVSSVRGVRGKRRLLGEAFARDPFTPVVNFRVQHAKDIPDLRDRFIRQLIRQGYRPLRYRQQVDGTFHEWTPVDHSQFDMSGLDGDTAAPVTAET